MPTTHGMMADDGMLEQLLERVRSTSRVAVVGASGNLKYRGRGGEIDAHDVVVRINGPPIVGYEAEVGERTDVRVGWDWALDAALANHQANHRYTATELVVCAKKCDPGMLWWVLPTITPKASAIRKTPPPSKHSDLLSLDTEHRIRRRVGELLKSSGRKMSYRGSHSAQISRVLSAHRSNRRTSHIHVCSTVHICVTGRHLPCCSVRRAENLTCVAQCPPDLLCASQQRDLWLVCGADGILNVKDSWWRALHAELLNHVAEQPSTGFVGLAIAVALAGAAGALPVSVYGFGSCVVRHRWWRMCRTCVGCVGCRMQHAACRM